MCGNESVKKILDLFSDFPEFVEIEHLSFDTVGNFGNTPLMVATCNGNIDFVGTLLEAGANINFQGENRYSALHEAASQGRADIVDLLLSSGIDPFLKNDDGLTAKELAKALGQVGVLEVFASFGFTP